MIWIQNTKDHETGRETTKLNCFLFQQHCAQYTVDPFTRTCPLLQQLYASIAENMVHIPLLFGRNDAKKVKEKVISSAEAKPKVELKRKLQQNNERKGKYREKRKWYTASHNLALKRKCRGEEGSEEGGGEGGGK